MDAASYNSPGMFCSPAMKMIMLYPKFFHTAMRMIAGIAHCGIAEPVHRPDADERQRVVQHAETGMVHEAPDDGHRHERRDHRSEVGGPEKSLQPERLRLEHERGTERHGDRRGALRRRGSRACSSGLSRRAGSCEELQVVLHSDEPGVADSFRGSRYRNR